MEQKFFDVDSDGIRLDRFLADRLQEARNQVEALIDAGSVEVEGVVSRKNGLKLQVGQRIVVNLPEIKHDVSTDVDFDVPILHEDDDLLIINKPSFLTIHDAPSVKEPTLVDWLKSKNITLSTLAGEERHGIVHRLDKETSGVMVVAKNNRAHQHLSEQLQSRQMGRLYLALIGLPLKEDVEVEQPIGRNPKNRLKMGVVRDGRYAKSSFYKQLLSDDGKQELILAKLHTGRTHQIRVHLAHLNRPVLGDVLYGFKSSKDTIPRVFLHATVMYLIHPETERPRYFYAPLADDIEGYMRHYFQLGNLHEIIDPDRLVQRYCAAV